MAEEHLPVLKSGIVMPTVSPEEAISAWKEYQALKAKIITPEDQQNIQGKTFLKKSYWRKVSRFFSLSLEILTERVEESNGIKTYFVTARATAPNGVFQDGDGSCATDEKGLEKTAHNARAIAVTRAKNRAISDLVGGGEVSAEEIVSETEEEKDTPKYIITEKQRKRLFAIYRAKGYTDDVAKAWIETQYGFKNSKDITTDVYGDIVKDFEEKRVNR